MRFGHFSERYQVFKRFTHFHSLGFTLVLPLLGLASRLPQQAPLPTATIAGILSVGLFFHLFAYILNDIIDLPVDRHHPRRIREPLVTGAISPTGAFALVGLSLAAQFGLQALFGLSLAALGPLIGAIVAMTIYNIWGKRLRLPPVTDIVQGTSWGALVLYGAVCGGGATMLSWRLSLFLVLFIVLVNGIHGGLRDLMSDRIAGARTTAIWLGFNLNERGRLHRPAHAVIYTCLWQALLTLVLLWSAAETVSEDVSAAWPAYAAAGLMLAGWLTLPAMLVAPGRFNIEIPIVAYTVLTLAALISLAWPQMAPGLRAIIVVVYFMPLMIDSSMWLWRRFQDAG